jgi:hypothetical protein
MFFCFSCLYLSNMLMFFDFFISVGVLLLM